MNCPTCPRVGLACRGEDVARLCALADPGHPAHNPAYLPWLDPARSMATPGPDPPPPSAESIRLTKLVRRCPWRSRPACGCATGICAIKRREVVQFECLACVEKYPL